MGVRACACKWERAGVCAHVCKGVGAHRGCTRVCKGVGAHRYVRVCAISGSL